MWSTHTMEYFGGLKRNKVPIYTTTPIQFENIVLHGGKKPFTKGDVYVKRPEEAHQGTEGRAGVA